MIETTVSRLAIFFLVAITLGLTLLLSSLGIATIGSNLLGWFLLFTGCVYFLGVIIVYWIRGIRFWEARSNGKIVKEERHDWSFWAIVGGMVAAIYLPPIEYLYCKAVLPRNLWTQFAGWVLILSGSALFMWARRALGKFYSGHVSVVDGQPLVQHGPYHFVRHPAYAGYLLMALGISVGFSSLLGLFLLPTLLLPAVIYRLLVEERLLTEHFGDQFEEYCEKTARLMPGIW